jgi:hypothetical protein
MTVKKLSFYGDSLMLPRPGVLKPEECHPRLLENWLRAKAPIISWEVLQRACGGHTITEIADWMLNDDSYYTDISGGIAVIQAGIVDGAPRPVSQRTRKLIGRLPKALKKHVVQFLHLHRARILRSGLGSVITPIGRFEKAARNLLERACRTHERVFIITTCPTNAATEA